MLMLPSGIRFVGHSNRTASPISVVKTKRRESLPIRRPAASRQRPPRCRATATGRGCVKTQDSKHFGGLLTPARRSIIEYRAIREVDFDDDLQRGEFSHGVGRLCELAGARSGRLAEPRWCGALAAAQSAFPTMPRNVCFIATSGHSKLPADRQQPLRSRRPDVTDCWRPKARATSKCRVWSAIKANVSSALRDRGCHPEPSAPSYRLR